VIGGLSGETKDVTVFMPGRSRRTGKVLGDGFFSVLAGNLTVLVEFGRIEDDVALDPVSDLTRGGIVRLEQVRVDLDPVIQHPQQVRHQSGLDTQVDNRNSQGVTIGRRHTDITVERLVDDARYVLGNDPFHRLSSTCRMRRKGDREFTLEREGPGKDFRDDLVVFQHGEDCLVLSAGHVGLVRREVSLVGSCYG
jgi:hypothetical protein